MEKSKDKVKLTLEEALSRLDELKLAHSSYYVDAIVFVVNSLDDVQAELTALKDDLLDKDMDARFNDTYQD